MALEKLYKIGINNFKCSILNDESNYLLTNVKYFASSDPSYLASILGDDLTPILLANPSGGTLMRFKDGGSIFYEPITVGTGEWGSTRIFITQCMLSIKYKNSINVVTEIVRYQHSLYMEKDGVRKYTPRYLCIAIDELAKKAYFMSLHHDTFSNGTFDGNLKVTPSYNQYITALGFYNIFSGNGDSYDPDPWSNGGYGDIGGGDGELDLSSDPIVLPSLPTSFSETGFIQMFCPTLSQIKDLSDYMWHGSFIDNFLKLFNNPMDIIISLTMFPFPTTPTGSRIVNAGNVVTTVTMSYTGQQYVVIDCGSLEVKNFYNAYIDYDPYTTCQIFLPYIGYQSLSLDDIMGKTIHVTYRVDLLTGVCAAYITADDFLLYTFTGACSASIPVSGQSFASIAQSVINVATSTALASKPTKTGSAVANGTKGASSSLASNVISMKPDVYRSGNVSSNVGILGAQKPYLIFSVPRTCLPKGQNKYLGYPSFMSTKLSALTGFTVVDEIRLENMTCSELEKDEIVELLKGGVVL